MSVMLAISSVIVALIIGFFAGKMYTERATQQTELKKQVEDAKTQMAQYKTEVSSHLDITRKLMNDMKKSYDDIAQQLAITSRLIETPTVTDDNINYFAADTTAQLRQVHSYSEQSQRRSETLAEQPSDYSIGSSGLFGPLTKEQKDVTEKA